MEKYEVKERYIEEDEIDLTELLKVIIKERKMIYYITIFFTIVSICFVLYKSNQSKNYGVDINFSEKTINKIAEYNKIFPNAGVVLDKVIQDSFDSLLNEKQEDVTVISSEKTNKISSILGENYNFIKIVDKKNKSYKLFTKIKQKDIEKISNKIIEIVNDDTKNLNEKFNENFLRELKSSQYNLNLLKEDIENANKEIKNIIEKNFSNISKENIESNLFIIAPILYVKYQEKLSSLNKEYLKVTELENIQKDNLENIFSFSGMDDIKFILINFPKDDTQGNYKIIILAGIIIGMFAGIGFAILKEPLKKLLREVKEEKV